MRIDSYFEKFIKESQEIFESIMDPEAILGDVLHKVGKSNQYIEAIIVCDESGLVLTYYSRYNLDDSYVNDILGPASAIIVATSKKVAESSNLARLNAVLLEGENGGILASRLNNGVVIAIQYKKGSPKGLIARDFKILKQKIEEVFSNYRLA